MSKRRHMRALRQWEAAQTGQRVLWWSRQRRKAGREALVARFLALPLSSAELAYREEKQRQRRERA